MPSTLRFVLIMLLPIVVWSYIHAFDTFTWWLEAMPALIALILLVSTYHRFRLTDLLYILIMLHCLVLLVGAHYTYAEVPLFHKLASLFHWQRNHYDRLGHFMQGAVPAIIIRELLIRTSPITSGKWLFAICVFGCLGISASYEIIEWIVSLTTADGAESFLGTQGDIWDTQKDMLMAGIGAICSLLLLADIHNRQLAKFLQQ